MAISNSHNTLLNITEMKLLLLVKHEEFLCHETYGHSMEVNIAVNSSIVCFYFQRIIKIHLTLQNLSFSLFICLFVCLSTLCWLVVETCNAMSSLSFFRLTPNKVKGLAIRLFQNKDNVSKTSSVIPMLCRELSDQPSWTAQTCSQQLGTVFAERQTYDVDRSRWRYCMKTKKTNHFVMRMKIETRIPSS